MTDNPTPAQADDEIDLLDLLVTVAENIKLLTLGTLLAGVLAFGAVSVWPSTYESSFTLQGEKKLGWVKEPIEIITPAKVNQLVTSPAVLADATTALQSIRQALGLKACA
ncbi:MAG: Wzz/FepE/Etk N-terminal domain-containing protein [Hydrogenophaga sp.]